MLRGGTLTQMSFIKEITAFGKLAGVVSVKKIASGFLSSMEGK